MELVPVAWVIVRGGDDRYGGDGGSHIWSKVTSYVVLTKGGYCAS